MHELSLCEGIRRIVLDQAHAHDATRVSRVRVEIGRFAGVEKDALAFAFDVVMKGTVAENAELVMLDLPGRAHCFDCGQEVTLDHRLDPCPVCGGGRVMPSGGDELRVKDLEVM